MGTRARLVTSTLAAAIVLLAALTQAPPARAATFTVDTLSDEAQISPPTSDCHHTTSGFCSLRSAIQAHNVAGGTNVLNLSLSGTYQLSIMGANENAAATGDLDVNGGTLSIANTSAGAATIDGGNLDRVFDLGPTTATTVGIDGVTIQHGYAFGAQGGGIRIQPGTVLTLTNSTLTDNATGATVTESGGGLALVNGGTASLTNVVVRNNRAGLASTLGGTGGGITNFGGTLSLTDVVVSGNTAYNGSNGSPGLGGGIWTEGNSISLNRVTISGNTAKAGASAGGVGGGLWSSNTATLTNVTISGNTAEGSGSVSGAGGGMINWTNATLTNVTISGNVAGGPAPMGGGIRNVSAGNLKNTIVANNTGGDCSGSTVSDGNNLDSDNSCNLTSAGDLPGHAPRLGPLQNNGGFSPTQALLSDSPAVDAGTNSGCPSVDQRGVTRPIDGTGHSPPTCDIGAYEYQPPPFAATLTPSPTATLTPTVTNTATPTLTPTITNTPTATATSTLTPTATITLTPSATPTTTTSPTPTRTLTAAPTATATSTPTRTLTVTATATAVLVPCSPRPAVTVAAVPNGSGGLQITVTANTNANTPTNQLRALRFGEPRPMSNAIVDIPGGPSGMSTAFTYTPPGVTPSLQFTVRRVAPGAATAYFVVEDTCGDWPTFVGGGPSAF